MYDELHSEDSTENENTDDKSKIKRIINELEFVDDCQRRVRHSRCKASQAH